MPSLLHVGVVLFRQLTKGHDPSGGLRTSYGITVPREAMVQLGWQPGTYLEVWVDKEKRILILRQLEVKPPELPRTETA